MSNGQVEEYDHPYKLLVTEEGDEEITRKKGHFA